MDSLPFSPFVFSSPVSRLSRGATTTDVSKMDPASPARHHRHQSSLERVICFSPGPALEIGERSRAKQKFYRIITHFQGSDESCNSQYNRALLVRLTYEYARSEESQGIFLRAFFQAMALSIDSENDLDFDSNEEDLRSALSCFVDYLLDNFFLPCKNHLCRDLQ